MHLFFVTGGCMRVRSLLIGLCVSAGVVRLEPRQIVRADLKLQVSSVEEAVTVEARAELINSESATISASFSSDEVLSLPANYRGADSTSLYELLVFLPGVQADSGRSEVGGDSAVVSDEYQWLSPEPGTHQRRTLHALRDRERERLAGGLARDLFSLEPALGFAYRPLAGNSTVFRGGIRIYSVTTLGTVFYFTVGIHDGFQVSFPNTGALVRRLDSLSPTCTQPI
jgi:hypothetical protein